MRSLLAAIVFLIAVPCAEAQIGFPSSQYQDEALLPLWKEANPQLDSSLVRHDIGDFGSCSFFKSRGLRWQQRFGDGSALEVRCERERGGLTPAFHLWFVDAQGARLEIARCIFKEGMNHGWFYTTAELDSSGKPLELAHVVWATLDAGKDDGGKRRLNRAQRTGSAEPYVDAMLWVFEPSTRSLQYFNDKFEYLTASRKEGKKPAIPHQRDLDLDLYVGSRMPELRQSYTKTFPGLVHGNEGL